MHSFDPKINDVNLTKCLQTLKQFYIDLYTDQVRKHALSLFCTRQICSREKKKKVIELAGDKR